jgi:hypothetical protein
MNTQTRISKMEHAGAWLGRVWRALWKREKQLIRWLVANGCPAPVAHILMWIIRLALLAVVLYTSIIVAVLLLAVLLIARVRANADLPSSYKAAEWRSGLLGFGLYDQSGWRIDPHDPNDRFREP